MAFKLYSHLQILPLDFFLMYLTFYFPVKAKFKGEEREEEEKKKKEPNKQPWRGQEENSLIKIIGRLLPLESSITCNK